MKLRSTGSPISKLLNGMFVVSFVAFFVRLIGYLVFFAGLITFIFMLGPLVQAEVSYRADRILQVKRTVPQITALQQVEATSSAQTVSFSNINASEDNIIPVSTEYGIVIEKINAKQLKVLQEEINLIKKKRTMPIRMERTYASGKRTSGVSWRTAWRRAV